MQRATTHGDAQWNAPKNLAESVIAIPYDKADKAQKELIQKIDQFLFQKGGVAINTKGVYLNCTGLDLTREGFSPCYMNVFQEFVDKLDANKFNLEKIGILTLTNPALIKRLHISATTAERGTI